MFELIKLLIDRLTKNLSIPDLVCASRDRKLADIGVEVFLLYSALNEIYVTGLQIVADLEEYLRWAEYKLQNDRPRDTYGYSELPELISQQLLNIAKFMNAFSALARTVTLIAPDAHNLLHPVMAEKSNMLRRLNHALENYRFTVYSYPELDRLATEYEEAKKCPEGLDSQHFPERERLVHAEFQVIIADVREELRADQIDEIRVFLATGGTKQRLADIKSALEDLRSAIEKHFSIQDILLRVGDPRLISQVR